MNSLTTKSFESTLLKQIREQLGLTQTELASIIQFDTGEYMIDQYIYHFEKDKCSDGGPIKETIHQWVLDNYGLVKKVS